MNLSSEDQTRVRSLTRAIRTISGTERVLTLLTSAYEHGTGTQIACDGYDDDHNKIAEDLIRALVTICNGREVKVTIDGCDVEIGRPMEKWLADLIYGEQK